MKRRGTRAAAAAILLGLAGVLSSCAMYYTSYFERGKEKPQVFDNLLLYPRIYGCIDSPVPHERVRGGAFAITIRVQRAGTNYRGYDWRDDPKAVDSLSLRFLDEMTAVFVPDSLVVYETPPGSAPIVLKADSTNYSPRREDFLTLKFPDARLNAATSRVRAVLYVTRPGLPPTADSVVFPMSRLEAEEKGLYMFVSETVGY